MPYFRFLCFHSEPLLNDGHNERMIIEGYLPLFYQDFAFLLTAFAYHFKDAVFPQIANPFVHKGATILLTLLYPHHVVLFHFHH